MHHVYHCIFVVGMSIVASMSVFHHESSDPHAYEEHFEKTHYKRKRLA